MNLIMRGRMINVDIPEKMEWIKVSDESPPKDKPFLGYDASKEEDGKIYVLIFVPARKYPKE